jgi:hypothetical protein
MQNSNTHNYNGYTIQPSTHRLPDGSFSSNLLLERDGCAGENSRYQFHVLASFDDETEALGHSCVWAREWVDCRG